MVDFTVGLKNSEGWLWPCWSMR